MPRQRHPAHFEPICGDDAYQRLEHFADRFAKGRYLNLFGCGPPGRMKTNVFRRAVEGKGALWVRGTSRPFDIFTQTMNYCRKQQEAEQTELIVVDDADRLYAHPDGLCFLRQLTDTPKPCEVTWNSHALRPEDKSFQSNASVAVIANGWTVGGDQIESLEDRGRLLLFSPPPAALHRRLGLEDWWMSQVGAQEVYDFVGEHLTFIRHEYDPTSGDLARGKGLSVRLYRLALEAKDNDEDWREYVLRHYLDPVDVALLCIESDPYFRDASATDKLRAFRTRTGKGRTAYYEHRRQLLGRLVKSGSNSDLLGRMSLRDPLRGAEDPPPAPAPAPPAPGPVPGRCVECGSPHVCTRYYVGKVRHDLCSGCYRPGYHADRDA
jgi:hypothetical protein